MAINIPYVKQTGLDLPEAYIRLHKLNTNRNGVSMEFAVYSSQENYEAGKPFEELIRKYLGEGKPEVPAIEETKDEEGNILTPAIEAILAVIGYEEYFGIDILSGEGNNPVKQAYVYLMSLPEFEEGTQI